MKGPTIEQIIDDQFNLSYHVHMTWADSQSMVPFERDILTHRLNKQIEYERKKVEDAQKD